MSILRPKFNKSVKDKEKLLVKQQITLWVLGFASGNLHVKKFDGSEISYAGVEYTGPPSQVFWSDDYIRPFLEDITLEVIHEMIQECLNNNLNLKTELRALSDRLKEMYAKIYDEMAKADQLMRGKGFPQNLPLMHVDHKISSMNDFLDLQIKMELGKNSNLKNWNKFISKIWKDPVWSTVIAAVILLFMPAIYHFDLIQRIIKICKNFLS